MACLRWHDRRLPNASPPPRTRLPPASADAAHTEIADLSVGSFDKSTALMERVSAAADDGTDPLGCANSAAFTRELALA